MTLLNKIRDYIPNENIKFNKDSNNGQLQVIFIDKKTIMNILSNQPWLEIKRRIDTIIMRDRNLPEDCSICSNRLEKRVYCTRCSCFWCYDCYINIYKSNDGIVICLSLIHI